MPEYKFDNAVDRFILKHPHLVYGGRGALAGGLTSAGLAHLLGDRKRNDPSLPEEERKMRQRMHKARVVGASIAGAGYGAASGLDFSRQVAEQVPYSRVEEYLKSKAFNIPAWAKGAKSQKAVKDVFKGLAMKNHPDLGGNADVWAKITSEMNAMKSHPDWEKMPKIGHLLPSYLDELHEISSSVSA